MSAALSATSMSDRRSELEPSQPAALVFRPWGVRAGVAAAGRETHVFAPADSRRGATARWVGTGADFEPECQAAARGPIDKSLSCALERVPPGVVAVRSATRRCDGERPSRGA